jgi:hypothetical protein
MNLKDILAISGEGTLFKFIAQGKNAVIVENLETGRRVSAGATAKVSALEEISIFTTGEDMPLGKVMDKIWEKENGGETVSHKLPDNDLKKYFGEAFPEYDRDRVYTSDIKKVLHWYNILHKLNLLVKEEEEKKEEETGAETKSEAVVNETPKEKKAPAAKKTKVVPAKTTVRKKPAKGE